MLEASVYLVLGVGTDIGKTFFVTNLCQKNQQIIAIKPVISGFQNNENSDSAKILTAMNLDINNKNIKKISPWRLKKPLSPNFAGKINYSLLLDFCKISINEAKKNKRKLLIEGAGGILSPITDEETFLDLASDLNIPIILITSNYLGSISHTLSAIESLMNRHLKLCYVVVNNNLTTPISDKKFIQCLKNFIIKKQNNFKIITLENFLKKC
jgi:dethiobiotin synthetase